MTDNLIKALDYMNSALSVLDKVDAPAHIGAQLSLTICRLEEAIAEQDAMKPARPHETPSSNLS